MEKHPEYLKDLTEIRTMMERSTKFLSLTGMSGIMAGVYALIGAYLANRYFYSELELESYQSYAGNFSGDFVNLIYLAAAIVVLTVGTAIILSYRKAAKNGQMLWNSAARRLLINMLIPLATGGLLILILLSKGFAGLAAPLTLIFYGLALVNASKFSYDEFKYLGLIEIALGLIAVFFIGYGLLFWAIGFGVMHIIYGIYMHLIFEK
ncbi:MAG TPA: hypothetical protein VF676_01345 [Flavobacterium sp.]|jgi:hypothetical protein